MSKQFMSGDVVPTSGIYTVTHAEHRLPHEVTLLRGQHFPRCSKCGSEVRFQIVRAATSLTDRREQIVLYSLPELEDAATAPETHSPTDGGPPSADPVQSKSPDPHPPQPPEKKRRLRAKAHRKGGRS